MDGTAKDMHYPAGIPDTPFQPPGLLVSGHFFETVPYHVIRRKGSNDWLLTFTLRGKGLYQQQGVRFEALPGDLVLLEPGAFHDYAALPGITWEFLWAHFICRPTWLGLIKWPAAGKGLYRLSVADAPASKRIRTAFFRCHTDARRGRGSFSDELALNALEEVLLVAARENAMSGERALSANIRRVLEHLSNNLAEPHSVASLSKLAGLSPSRLAHLFKEETGDSLIAYLLKLRLREAARLLEFSGRRVKEVAGDVGFASEFYFSRQFRKHFRVSPREYQATRRKGD